MEIKKNSGNWETKEAILRYLLRFGKENKYRLARVFKIGTEEVIEVLRALENERKIEMQGSKAKPITKLMRTRSMKKELAREAEELEEIEPPKEAEESEKAIEQWLADMK